MNPIEIAKSFSEALKLEKYKLCGVYFSNEKPANALELKKKGNGCIVPMILKASTGISVVFAEESTGWPCSAFYLGFQDTIFEGIEYFLSNKDDFWRPCERFIQNPEFAFSSFLRASFSGRVTKAMHDHWKFRHCCTHPYACRFAVVRPTLFFPEKAGGILT